MNYKAAYASVASALRSRRGRNAIAFCVFLLIAAFLWWVIALNDEGQADIKLPVKITHQPDSVTIVSAVPPTVTVSMRARGSALLKNSIGKAPDFAIDFRLYRHGNSLRLTNTDLKAIARAALGDVQVVLVSPDSLTLLYTAQPPRVLPVKLDVTATPGPQAALSGSPFATPDSVKVYFSGNRPADVTSISTEPVRLSSINETEQRRVRLIAPRNCRVVPDSVTVTVKVDPLIFKTIRVPVEGVNVPKGTRLITFPSQVEAMYMIPVSLYLASDPHIKVVADYQTISPSTGKVRLRVAEASDELQNVHIAVDSVEYIIEKLER